MRRWIFPIILMACGVAMAATDPATQPDTRPAPEPTNVAPADPPVESNTTSTPYSNGRQRRGENGRGENGRSRRSTGFTAEPTSRPGDLQIASSGPLPQDFEILNYRNIFYKGHLPSPEVSNRPAPASIEAHSLETVLMFNGVTITDGKPTAFLENTDQGTVLQVHVGDTVAQGKIVAIALDSLEYQLNGRTTPTHVQIGQNLAGSNSWGTVAASQPSSTGSASMDAMLEKLRQKRAAELGGK